MARELPELLAALVDVAQRGRTLGVHLILATQRPAGRGQRPHPDQHQPADRAARAGRRRLDRRDRRPRRPPSISRHRPGRAYVRLGPDEVVPIQTALITCVTDATSDAARRGHARSSSARRAARAATPDEPERGVERPSDLARLVDAIIEANAAEGIAPPRRPWPEPLPAQIDLADARRSRQRRRRVVALADEPRRADPVPGRLGPRRGQPAALRHPRQRDDDRAREPRAQPRERRIRPSSSRSTRSTSAPASCAALETLPHTGSVILAGDRERQMRLIRRLRRELDERRATAGASSATTVVLIDNLAALRSEFDDVAGMELMDALAPRLRRRAAGRHLPGGHRRPPEHRPDRLDGGHDPEVALPARRSLRLRVARADASRTCPYATPGPRRDGRDRAADPARPAAAVAQRRPPPRSPAATPEPPAAAPVGVLPTEVALGSLDIGARPATRSHGASGIGVRESDLGVAELVLYEGEHAARRRARAQRQEPDAVDDRRDAARGARGEAELHIAAHRRAPLPAARLPRARPLRRRGRRGRRAARPAARPARAGRPADRRRRGLRRRRRRDRRPARRRPPRPARHRRGARRLAALALRPLDEGGPHAPRSACCCGRTSTSTATSSARPCRAAPRSR